MERVAIRIAIVTVLLISGLFLIGCSDESSSDATAQPDTQFSGRLTLTGSSTVAPLASEIGKRFETLHPDVRVDVQTGGSSRGTADARRGTADIGMASRALNADESDLLAYPIARDGIGMIVHSSNPIKVLSDQQIVAIYTGTIENWREVGGSDAPITVVNKAEGHSTLELFLHYFKIKSVQVQADVIIGDNQQGIKTVAGNPNAIGYVSIGSAEYEVSNGTLIKLLPLSGVEASVEHVQDGTFPLSRPLNLILSGPPEGLVKAFIDFAQSSEVYDLIEEQFFVPLRH